MSTSVAVATAVGQAGDERRRFLAALAVASLLPLVALTLARLFAPPGLGTFNFALAFVATGFHVALTPFFYFEPELAELRRQHPVRFVWAPLALCVGTAAIVLADHATFPWVVLFYFIWQLYHFQRQNVGVLAFVSSMLKVSRTTRLENVSIELAAYAGILGFLALDGVPLPLLGSFSGTLMSVGMLAQAIAAALAVFAWIVRFRSEGWSWFSPWHMLLTLFFAGTFLVPSLDYAFGTYAYAHGLQYIIFMYLLSFSRGRASARLSPFALTAGGFAGALVLTVIADRAMFQWSRDAIFAIYLGLVMSHFVVDAIVWRLSEPTQRGYVRRAFSFVWD